MCNTKESEVTEMDPRVAALSQEFGALAQRGGRLTDMVKLRERIGELGSVGLTAFDERCRLALYSAASQAIAWQEHLSAINGRSTSTHSAEVF